MIYDISQPVFECAVFPGDPEPERVEISSIDKGDFYNLTAFTMCAHNGTHIDAPSHFIQGGKTVGEISPERFTGRAYVFCFSGDIGREDAGKMIEKAASFCTDGGIRILIKGKATVTEEAAQVFAREGVYLLGNESQTVGPEAAPMAVHLILLRSDVVILEGIRLSDVPEGGYFLSCGPLNLGASDGAPCRALLMPVPLS